MRKIAVKLASWGFMLGLVFCGIGLSDIYVVRNVSQTPTAMEYDSIAYPGQGELVYASVSGGKLDIANTYEESHVTKNSDEAWLVEYFVPVVDETDDSLVYVVKQLDAPMLENMFRPVDYTGLMQHKSALSPELQAALNGKYPGSRYSVLDTNYTSETLIEQLLGMKIFFFILFGSLGILVALNRQPAGTETTGDDLTNEPEVEPGRP